jgi:hypothetical protein
VTKEIRRIFDGVYEKPIYSALLQAYVPANPETVAYALARNYHWTISPCGDVALNKLGLSTQVPVVWSYKGKHKKVICRIDIGRMTLIFANFSLCSRRTWKPYRLVICRCRWFREIEGDSKKYTQNGKVIVNNTLTLDMRGVSGGKSP